MTSATNELEKSVIDLSTHKTCVQISGSAHNTPVLFLHSIGLDHRAFSDVSRRLGTHQSISYDQRGHGLANDISPSAIHLGGMADDALRILDKLDIERAHLVGHSLGGAVAATALLKEPSRWYSIAIACSPSQGGPAFSKRAEDALAQGRPAIIKPTVQRWFTPEIRLCGDESLDYALECLQAMGIPQWAALWKALSAFPGYAPSFWPLSKYLVVSDDADISTPPKTMQTIAENLPGASLRMSKNGGHMAPLTQPTQIADILFNFWKDQ